jgi:uncharacterized protein (DUF58 family)
VKTTTATPAPRTSRVLVLPGRNTIGLVAVLAAMWYAGVTQSNGAAYLLCFLLASVAAVSTIHAWANLRGLSVRVEPIAPVFVGEQIVAPLVVDAERGSTPLAVRIHAGEVAHAAFFPEITKDRERRAAVRFQASARGCFERVKLIAVSQYPLGFFNARRTLVATQKWFVYPQPAGSAPIPRTSTATQERRDGARLEGDDFAGVRPWLQGESQRHIDWKAAARGQPMLTKQWAGETGDTVQLDWQDAPGETEARLSQLARWILTAERSGANYGLTVPGKTIPPSHGDAHFHACLQTLAVFPSAGS